MILLIDNYDSFTYNLYQYLGMCGEECLTLRNDKFDVKSIGSLKPDKIVISPGPGTPDEAGLCIEIIKNYYDKIPILGICLGHQCIGRAFGAKVSYAKEQLHGKYSDIYHEKKYILHNIASPFYGARYHSLSVLEKNFPKTLEIYARTKDGEIMALKHREHPVYGLQFHPESILTPDGLRIIDNFVGREE